MGSNSLIEYNHLLDQLNSYTNIPLDLILSFREYIVLMYQSDLQNRFGKPMLWVGFYIALASLFCVLAMFADLVHGFMNKKLWFPCKYFTLNAASLSVIAVAMKLPMDLNNSMPGDGDRLAKLGSMAFMCTIMANLQPSLASMTSNELVTNIIALGILVITLAVNVSIQIKTGVISFYIDDMSTLKNITDAKELSAHTYISGEGFIAIFYVPMLLMLLIIHACSSLAILKSKEILELKYQARHESEVNDIKPGRLSVEKLKRHVTNYWIMAYTGSPQFMTACSATTSASGIICAASTALYNFNMLYSVAMDPRDYRSDYKSDYKWSMLVILVIQSIGVTIGTIAPLFRCFADFSFKLSTDWIWNHIKVFKVEKYWTQKFSDWKQSSTPFSTSSRKYKIGVQSLKIVLLNVCIGLQKTVVVACKMIGLIFIFFVICVFCCFQSWRLLKAMLIASGIVLVNNPEQSEQYKYRRLYVLQLQDDMELAERTLKGITKSVNHLIQKAEKQYPKSLMKLLEASSGFEGVGKYDSYYIPSLTQEKYTSCWSLPVVTLTTIAISLPKIQRNIRDSLLRGVSEGLMYVTHVEESLNATDEYARVHKVAKMLWLEVEVYHKWLGNNLKTPAPHLNTAGLILQWFNDISKNIISEVESKNIGSPDDDNSIFMSFCANSMYRVTETFLRSYHQNYDDVSQELLFFQISSMIGDILAACLTNLPQVIIMKCHANAIEKREDSVRAVALLLGETTQIINNLNDRELPSMNPDDFPFIDEWRAYFTNHFP